jgi:membrane protease YdiL (CAAX protease family)
MSDNENTNSSSTHKPRLFRWALWWGLGIVVICLAIIIIDDSVNPNSTLGKPIDDATNALVYNYGIWIAVIFIGFVGPIIEELSFRLWGNGKLWTGITSVIIMALWCLAIGWWLSFITLLCGIAILVLFREDKTKRLFALMLLSSALFAVLHMGNYDANEGWFMFLVSILDKFGFGLVASYLVINHNILWSIGLHILNNGIIAVLFGVELVQASNSVVTIDNENFRLEVRPVLVHNDSICRENRFYSNTDTNHYFGSTANFAGQAFVYEAWQNGSEPNGDTVSCVTCSSFPNCSFTLVYKTQPFDHHGLIVAMEKEGLIKIDTTYSSTYEMRIADTSLLSKVKYDSTFMSYNYVRSVVRYFSDIPIITGAYASSLDSLYVRGDDLIRENKKGTQTLDELRQVLAPQGIIIEPSKRRMTMLNIKSTYDPLSETDI